LEAEPQDIPLDILHEDPELIVLNKQAGLVTHPAPGSMEGTLVNGLLFHCRKALPTVNGAARPGIVHRLDKDTTGCLVVAKTDRAFQSLTRQIQERVAKRGYLSLSWGTFEEDDAVVEAPIGRSPRDRKKMAVLREGGRPALTRFKVLERFRHAALLELALETGRTHQIRVHLSSIHHPVVGDAEYGSPPQGLDPETLAFVRVKVRRQMLHAARLEFSHPAGGKRVVFEAPLPADFQAALGFFRQHL
jgi:23S rRNA pseudouridine1911/1915/1917 synthase